MRYAMDLGYLTELGLKVQHLQYEGLLLLCLSWFSGMVWLVEAGERDVPTSCKADLVENR